MAKKKIHFGQSVRIVKSKNRFVKRNGKWQKAPARNLAPLIRSEIQRSAEKKVQTFLLNGQNPLSLRNAVVGITNNVYPLCPYTGAWTIAQGSGEGNRIGNKVHVSRAILNINLTSNPYNVSTNATPQPMFVKMWFCKYKPFPTDTVPANALYGGTAGFLQVGSTNTGLTGTFADLQYQVNRDLFVVYGQRTFKIAPAVFEGTGSSPTYGNYANNDFKLSVLKRIDVTKWLPKQFIFDDAASNITSSMVSMVVQLVASNGTPIGLATTPINFGFGLTVEYTDI